MKTLKILYYRMKQKGAIACFKYWHKKALANMDDVEKGAACFDHMMHWIIKMLDYNVAIRKELES
jgi:hypothetical protein